MVLLGGLFGPGEDVLRAKVNASCNLRALAQGTMPIGTAHRSLTIQAGPLLVTLTPVYDVVAVATAIRRSRAPATSASRESDIFRCVFERVVEMFIAGLAWSAAKG